MKIKSICAIGTLLLVLGASAVKAGELVVNDAWVRSAPPNAPALGAFMVLENHSARDIAVVDARSSLEVNRVELHRSMMADGVMKMIPQEFIPVAANSSTVLEPGSWHVMLIGPSRVPAEGESVELTLVLDDGTETTVVAGVRKGKKMMHDHEHGMKSE